MPERIATPPMPKRVTSCRPAVPPPPVCGAPTGYWVAGGVAACVARRVGAGVGLWEAAGFEVGESEAVGLALGRPVAVALPVGVALPVAVALPVGVALPVADALADAEALPVEVADRDGEGVPACPLVEICGVGVKTDVGEPPPVQPARATAVRLAPAVARTARRHIRRVAADRATADRATADRATADLLTADRLTVGRVATGTVKRTFMKPPRISGGQWHRSTHLSICHPDRQGKSERTNSQPPFRPDREIRVAGRRDVRIDGHI
jgi:hypothetical protein